jgi:hypothetical protein
LVFFKAAIVAVSERDRFSSWKIHSTFRWTLTMGHGSGDATTMLLRLASAAGGEPCFQTRQEILKVSCNREKTRSLQRL